ncbi:alpha/beta hydrolase [Glutamicibacter ardleyensis]|uniref:alpha/beta hydrolase n=1 Tax=Glutamicibacter ardleyensis TaxID=225894 RepID=UPI0027E413EC|nr:alpha/beta hydrolase [Glutamicibacter ardleyensis]
MIQFQGFRSAPVVPEGHPVLLRREFLRYCGSGVRGRAGRAQPHHAVLTLQWDGKNLAVAGDSSGGTFTAAICAMAKDEGFDKISHQLLFYPSLDLDFDESRYASLRENATGYGLETWMFKPHNSFYLENGADPADPRVSPIKREDFSGLPKTLVITAEHDPLRDEGELYAERLAKAGVDAQLERFDGANHGFVVNFAWIDEFARVFETAGKFLSE